MTTDKIEKWKPSTPRQFMTGHQVMFTDITKAAQSEYREFQISAMLLISESAGLRECLNTPKGTVSLRNALARAAASGLSLNPALGEIAIIPRDEYVNGQKTGVKLASAQVMKNGMIRQALEPGTITALKADLVCDNDDFEISKSIDGDSYKHKIAIKDRGDIIGYYAAGKESNGTTHVKYMTIHETTAHGERYAGSKKDGSMFKKSFDGYSIKTVLKALLRNLYLAPKTREIITVDDMIEVGDWEAVDALPLPTGSTDPGTSADDLAGKMTTDPKDKGDGGSPRESDNTAAADSKKPDDII